MLKHEPSEPQDVLEQVLKQSMTRITSSTVTLLEGRPPIAVAVATKIATK